MRLLRIDEPIHFRFVPARGPGVGEAVPDEDVVGEALSVLVSVLDGVSVSAVEPELEAEADVDWPLVTETDAEALALPVPLGVSAADSVLLGLAVTVPVAVSKLEPLPEAVCE